MAGVDRKAEPQPIPVGKARSAHRRLRCRDSWTRPHEILARELGDRLERDGFSAAVINPRFVKPLDREMLAAYARRVAAFVTFEDHVKMGGFGSAVIEALEDMGSRRPRGPHRLARPVHRARKDRSLRARYGLTVDDAYAQVLPLLHSRKRRTLVAS